MVQGKTYKVLDTGSFVMADDIEPTADGGYTQVSTGHKVGLCACMMTTTLSLMPCGPLSVNSSGRKCPSQNTTASTRT